MSLFRKPGKGYHVQDISDGLRIRATFAHAPGCPVAVHGEDALCTLAHCRWQYDVQVLPQLQPQRADSWQWPSGLEKDVALQELAKHIFDQRRIAP